MFEQQYDEEMAAEIRRLEAKLRAAQSGHPEWQNACADCGCKLSVDADSCEPCKLLNEQRCLGKERRAPCEN